ncbi:MAG: signal peptidase II [Candidatus Paceibacterota bacterium]|jgi:signal peptidase II
MQTEINPKKRYARTFFFVVFGVSFLDQTIKFALANKILDYPVYRNHGALFGLPFDGSVALIFLALAFFYAIYKKEALLASCESGVAVYAGLIFGGIMGNAIDRITAGYVMDYITLAGYFSFNISDLAILIGSLLFFLKFIGK